MSPTHPHMRRALVWMLLSLVPLPIGWPHHLAIGVTDSPGDARQLTHHAPLDLRYQYLAGGVNTGYGWATWNPAGTFASMYVRESIAAHMVSVLTYYQLLSQLRRSAQTNSSETSQTYGTRGR